jgi:DNA-binding NarL/FixJ family response regulator
LDDGVVAESPLRQRILITAGPQAQLAGSLVLAFLEIRLGDCTLELNARASEVEDDEVAALVADTGRTLRIFTSPPSPRVVSRALAAGPCALLTLTATRAELEAAVAFLEGGVAFTSSGVVAALSASVGERSAELMRLTPRQRQVLELLAKGDSNREIALSLVVSTNTVRTHIQTISASLGVSSRGKLAARAREMNLG